MTDTYQLTPSWPRELAGYVIKIPGLLVPVNDQAYLDWLAAPNTPLSARALTVYEELAKRTAAGITITSTSNPGTVNGTYPIDPQSQQVIAAIYSGIRGGDGVPGGGATFQFTDITGVNHAFTAVDFTGFAKAVRDLVYALIEQAKQQSPVWPNQMVTIP